MKRVLFICLLLVLALGCWSAVGAEDGFYVIPTMKVVPKTGQTATYNTGDDGALQRGVASPSPRFTDNGNGTVTDNLTKLIWMKNAGALGLQPWPMALTTANNLHSGSIPGLNDGSQAGDWRLPNVRELQSLVDYGRYNPALPADHPFTEVVPSEYWSSTTFTPYTTSAWLVSFENGALGYAIKLNALYGAFVWCVRGGP
jgi:hypothetical protein